MKMPRLDIDIVSTDVYFSRGMRVVSGVEWLCNSAVTVGTVVGGMVRGVRLIIGPPSIQILWLVRLCYCRR